MARFREGSRYSNGVVSINRDNDQFLINREPLVLDPSDSDSFLSVTEEMLIRPDVISFVVYGRPDLWWAIFDINNIKNVFDLKLNQRLRIPEITSLLSSIDNLNKKLI